jgi:dephospho-CoA kinase
MMTLVHAGKPIIGIVGGIGSGKTFVARLFEELGGLVISSDEQVKEVYRLPEVKQRLREWWGESVFLPNGDINRRAIAGKIFSDPEQRRNLEQLLHPLVGQARDRLMASHQNDPNINAFIWDTPLLFETGLNEACDAIVFVDAPLTERAQRVKDQRNWTPEELTRRENSQWPLDTKREIADYVISNAADADSVRDQVRRVFSLILANTQ